MTAGADPLAARAARLAGKANSLSALLIGAAFVGFSSPAAAQISGAVSIFSDDRYRGYTLSDGRPVGILDLYYDDPSGFYGTVSGKLVASEHAGIRPLGLVLNAGYARRLSSGLTIDVGATHSTYSEYSDRAAARSYTEAYAGLSGKFLTARIYASPDYLKDGSLYGELNATAEIAPKLTLSGHAGLLLPLEANQNGYRYRREFDWRIGVARQFGPVSLQAAWTAVSPGQRLYRDEYHSRDALVVGVTYAL